MIRTVLGEIPQETLGICYPHEHLLAAPPEPYASNDPDLVLDDEDAIRQELLYFKQAGGNAIVEMTPLDYHPQPDGLCRLTEMTGIHIIAVTGYLKDKFCRPHVERQTVTQLTERFIRDLESHAGVIKAASSLNTITPAEQKVFRAAAHAHQATGALISTHTEAGTMALEQITLLQSAGVPPERMLIGHLDRKLEWDYHQQIAKTGVYMGFDQISKEKYYPDRTRIDMIKRLIAAGHQRQIMLSMDLARKSYFPSYGGGPGFTYLLWRFIPWLRVSGITEDAIEDMLVNNPARALNMKDKTP